MECSILLWSVACTYLQTGAMRVDDCGAAWLGSSHDGSGVINSLDPHNSSTNPRYHPTYT
jgi:hypothetical protein